MPLNDAQLSAFAYFIEVDEQDPAKRKKAQTDTLKMRIPAVKADAHYNLACVYSLQNKRIRRSENSARQSIPVSPIKRLCPTTPTCRLLEALKISVRSLQKCTKCRRYVGEVSNASEAF